MNFTKGNPSLIIIDTNFSLFILWVKPVYETGVTKQSNNQLEILMRSDSKSFFKVQI